MCLDSVIAQTYEDYEVVCVNDGSTDDSLTILNEYALRCSQLKVVNQPNRGLSAARNSGIKNASGDYVFFLDSDDWIEPNTLKVLADALSDEDMVCFNGRRYIENNKEYEIPDVMVLEDACSGWEYYNHHALNHRQFAFVCVVLRLYRRAFLMENHLTFTEGIFHEDNMFTPLACYYAKKVKVIPDCLYNYRVRSNSIMTTRDVKHKKDILFIANTLSDFFTQKDGIDKIVVYRSLTHHYQSVFMNAGQEDRALLPLVDWHLYRTVSRTKLRHRVLFWALRISPKLFRMVNKLL